MNAQPISAASRMPQRSKILAYALPFIVFAAFLAVTQLLHGLGRSIWLGHAEFWVYPLQTLICGGLVFFYRRHYPLEKPRRAVVASIAGIVIFGLWILPQSVLGYPARTEGFNPDILAANPALYWLTIAFRFLRLVIVVPFVEEIFWRGFLLRYFIDADFERLPIGAWSPFSFAAVVGLFMLSHNMADWPAAIAAGALFNGVAYATRSLSACVLAHAVANCLLGLWIMQTRQWGFW